MYTYDNAAVGGEKKNHYWEMLRNEVSKLITPNEGSMQMIDSPRYSASILVPVQWMCEREGDGWNRTAKQSERNRVGTGQH